MQLSTTIFDMNTWCVVPSSWNRRCLDAFDTATFGPLVFARCTDGKFADDRCFESSADGFLLVDGVVLNSSSLGEPKDPGSFGDRLRKQILHKGVSSAVADLRGPFSGCWYDVATQTLTAFANQTGETAVYSLDNTPCVASSFDVLARVAKENSVDLTFSETAAKMMLSFGYMVDETTFANEVERILPGRTLGIEVDTPARRQTQRYWQLSNEEDRSLSFDDAVEGVNAEFERSNRLALDKDLEGGFDESLVDLSGGMDTRSVNFVLTGLGANLTNLTYSQSGSREQKCSFEVARYLGSTCLYLPLDGGGCLLDPTSILRLNGGSAYYGGITGGKLLLERLNRQRYGLEHTGMLGDVVFGTFSSTPEHERPNTRRMKYSQVNDFAELLRPDDFENDELFKMETRGFLGAVSSYLTRQHYVTPTSPFLDVDTLNFCFSVPLQWRVDHRLYEAWLQRFHPRALTLPSTRALRGQGRLHVNSLRSSLLKVRASTHRLQRLENQRTYSPRVIPFAASSGMNPMEVWFAQNEELRTLIAHWGREAQAIPADVELRRALGAAFARGSSVIEKLLGVTVATMYQLYF